MAASRPVHHHRGMAAALARHHVERRALPLEQAFRVHEVPRPAVADERGVRTGARRMQRPPTGVCSRSMGGGFARRRLSDDLDTYREYIAGSRAEFTVAKDQNVRLRSGWFSDRSATYLAAGRPVVTQDTGFGGHLPTGRPVRLLDDGRGGGSHRRHQIRLRASWRAAHEIAAEYFDHAVVLPQLLSACGV